MTKRQSFFEATKLKNIWNKKIRWDKFSLAVVMFHDNPWKIVSDTDDFNTIAIRGYKPIAEFHTQQELWDYIKNLTNNKNKNVYH